MRRFALKTALVALLALPFLVVPATASATGHGGSGAVHVVQTGDTLYGIAWHYGVSAQAIASANGLYNPDWIYAGQRLIIPGSHMPAPPSPEPRGYGGTHMVQHGETLYSIAWRYGTTLSALIAANGLANPDYIYAGQVLSIPGGMPPGPGPAPGPGPKKPGHGCGYTYTVVRGDTLSGIAYRHGSTVAALARANGLGYPYTIHAGQGLHIPCHTGPGHTPPGPRPPHSKPEPRPGPRPAACLRDVQIVEPREGERVGGTLQIIGTASIPDFQFYKLEYAMGHNPSDGSFHSINDVYRTAVRDSVLGVWFVGNMPRGNYTLRLTAVDVAGQFERPCDVHIHIGR